MSGRSLRSRTSVWTRTYHATPPSACWRTAAGFNLAFTAYTAARFPCVYDARFVIGKFALFRGDWVTGAGGACDACTNADRFVARKRKGEIEEQQPPANASPEPEASSQEQQPEQPERKQELKATPLDKVDCAKQMDKQKSEYEKLGSRSRNGSLGTTQIAGR
ncbi:hypothetical protein DFH06DRAFT_1336941 [Mycena polygramma]|nr:hypothetical protein DFH06DRAFT_1336941 [Mycena polygramma]